MDAHMRKDIQPAVTYCRFTERSAAAISPVHISSLSAYVVMPLYEMHLAPPWVEMSALSREYVVQAGWPVRPAARRICKGFAAILERIHRQPLPVLDSD